MSTMMHFSIVINTERFQISDLGIIGGPVWLDAGHACFPDRNWEDFPIPLLCWWIGETLSLLGNQQDAAEWDFMDGPYVLHLTPLSPTAWLAIGRRNGLHGPEDTELGTISPADALVELATAANLTLRACQQRGWRNADIDSLDLAHRAVRKAMD